MNLIEEMESLLAKEESMFRAQLLREDVARLRKLAELADAHDDRDEFRKAGARIGWTNGDLHTRELKDHLDPLLDAIYSWRRGEPLPEAEAALRRSWDNFHIERMRILFHSL